MRNFFIKMLGQKEQIESLTLLGKKGAVKNGGNAVNHIQQWDFFGFGPEQNTFTYNADYHTKIVYGSGREAYYPRAINFLKAYGPRPTRGKDMIESLRLTRNHDEKAHFNCV